MNILWQGQEIGIDPFLRAHIFLLGIKKVEVLINCLYFNQFLLESK